MFAELLGGLGDFSWFSELKWSRGQPKTDKINPPWWSLRDTRLQVILTGRRKNWNCLDLLIAQMKESEVSKSREGQNPPSTATHTFGMCLSRETPKIIVGRTKASLGWQTFQTTEELEDSNKKNNWNGKGLSGQQKTTKGKLTSFQNSQSGLKSRGRTIKTPNYAQFNSKTHKEMKGLLQRKVVGRSYKLTTFQTGIKKQFSHTRPGRQPGPLGAQSLEGQILKCISNPKGSAKGEAGKWTNSHQVQLGLGGAAKEWHSTTWFSLSVTTANFNNLGWKLVWQALNSG